METLAELRSTLTSGGALTARDGARLVGVVRYRLAGDVLDVGRLTVAPDRQGEGMGSRLLAAVEEVAPARRAALVTGSRSEGNLRFYARCGYREVRRETVHERLVLVPLEKRLGG